MSNKTLDYYDNNADAFVSNTLNVDFNQTQDKFLSVLHGKSILDFGCGSGRDTKYFIDKGFELTATDGSGKLCKIASEVSGINVKQMLFQELDDIDKYDGIWACSSILHLSKTDLLPVINKMVKALKPDGVIYTSFKYGNFEGERNGRYFIDFTEKSFTEFIKGIHNIRIENYWITEDVRPGRGDEKWLNMLLRKTHS